MNKIIKGTIKKSISILIIVVLLLSNLAYAEEQDNHNNITNEDIEFSIDNQNEEKEEILDEDISFDNLDIEENDAIISDNIIDDESINIDESNEDSADENSINNEDEDLLNDENNDNENENGNEEEPNQDINFSTSSDVEEVSVDISTDIDISTESEVIFSESIDVSTESETMPENLNYGYRSLNFIAKKSKRNDDIDIFNAPNLPEKYDTREVYNDYNLPIAPPVRNQNPYGTCWAFSTINMFETSIRLKNFVTKDFNSSSSFFNFSCKYFLNISLLILII